MSIIHLTIFLCQTVVFLAHIPVSSADTPLYYGWFFNAEVADSVKEITQQYLNDAYQSVSNFSEFLNQLSETPLDYYVKPLDPNTQEYDPLYHVTAKFCGNTDCTDYTNNANQFIGKEFKTEMIGLFFTNRTFGIRIKLSEEQQFLFDESPSRSQIPQGKSSNVKVVLKSEFPGIEFVEQDEHDFKPSTSKAHVTIGCGPNIPAVTTGYDLLEVVKQEQDGDESLCANYTIKDAIIRQYGDDCGIFVVYPKNRMLTNLTFKSYNNGNRLSSQFLNWFRLSGPLLALSCLRKPFF